MRLEFTRNKLQINTTNTTVPVEVDYAVLIIIFLFYDLKLIQVLIKEKKILKIIKNNKNLKTKLYFWYFQRPLKRSEFFWFDKL